MRRLVLCLCTTLLACACASTRAGGAPKPPAAVGDASARLVSESVPDAGVAAAGRVTDAALQTQRASASDAAASQSDAAAAANQSTAAWATASCVADSVHITGQLEGRSVDIVHPAQSFSTGTRDYGVTFGLSSANYYGGARASLDFSADPNANTFTTLIVARLQLEAPDPYGDSELCADGNARGLRGADRVAAFMERVSALHCPGQPVSGTLTIGQDRVTGLVDGHSVDEPITSRGAGGRDAQTSTQQIGTQHVNLSFTTDDPTYAAASGNILEGRVQFFAATSPEIVAAYCVGAATFTRTPGNNLGFAATLSNLSALGTCAARPALGSLTVCVEDSFLMQ